MPFHPPSRNADGMSRCDTAFGATRFKNFCLGKARGVRDDIYHSLACARAQSNAEKHDYGSSKAAVYLCTVNRSISSPSSEIWRTIIVLLSISTTVNEYLSATIL